MVREDVDFKMIQDYFHCSWSMLIEDRVRLRRMNSAAALESGSPLADSRGVETDAEKGKVFALRIGDEAHFMSTDLVFVHISNAGEVTEILPTCHCA